MISLKDNRNIISRSIRLLDYGTMGKLKVMYEHNDEYKVHHLLFHQRRESSSMKIQLKNLDNCITAVTMNSRMER